VKTGGLEGRFTAPGVDVVAPEVNSFLLGTAVEVLHQRITDFLVVVGSITDGNGSVSLLLDVSLGVANGGLDECRSAGVGGIVSNFVTSKEAENVVVLLEGIDDIPNHY